MTASELLRKTTLQLKKSGIEDYKYEARQIIMFVCDISYSELLLFGGADVSTKKQEKAEEIIAKRCNRYPLQYLLGEWEFYSLPFKVKEGVLIPRPDTEILVDTALDYIGEGENLDVIDLCSGSGCVAVAIAKNTENINITALEKSPEAFDVLQENIKENHAEVTAVLGDVFDGTENYYDLIVSNPPYIETDTLDSLQPEVKYEPVSALDGGEDGLMFYKAIADKWIKSLKPGGAVIVEIGFNQAEQVMKIFTDAGLVGVESKTDLNGNQRVIIGTLPL